MKKAIALLLLLACLLSMTACGGQKDLKDTFIEETLIYNKNDISITATGISHVEDAYILHIEVDNRTKESLIPSFSHPIANSMYLPFEVQIYRNGNLCKQIVGNSTATVDLCLSAKEFALAGMDALTQLDFSMKLTVPSSKEARVTQTVTIPVRSNGSVSTPDFGGEVVIDGSDLQVRYKLVDGMPYFFFVNNSRRPVSLYLKDVTINGHYYDYVGLNSISVDPGFCTVDTFSDLSQLMMPPGDTAQVELTALVSDIEGNFYRTSDPISYTCPMYETNRQATQQPRAIYTDERVTIWADRFYDKTLESQNIYFRIENHTDANVLLAISNCQVDAATTDNFMHNHIAAKGYDYVGPLLHRFAPAETFSKITLQYALSLDNEVLAENQTVEFTFEN